MNTRAPDEAARLAALDSFDVLDTPPEEAFERITRLTRRIFGVPIATVAFIDGHRLWFKARLGVDGGDLTRSHTLCSRTLAEDEALVIPDTLQDPRFAENPLVMGGPKLRFYAGVPLRTAEGHAIGTVCAMDHVPRAFDAADREALYDLGRLAMDILELRRQADHDALTGLLSRRAFRREGERACRLAGRHKSELSCLAVDLDHFKRINDEHGHATGDRVLRACADACRGELRETDLLGRTGGEEFAAILPQTGPAGAFVVAEKIRTAIAALRFETAAGPLAVSASIGVASRDRAAPDIDALLQGADGALYAAKAAGRNTCRRSAGAAGPEPDRRRRVLKAGRIVFNAGRSTVDCTVRSLSETEAGLDVISTAAIPDSFKLQVEADGWTRLCQVVGKQSRHLEVRFG